MSIPVSKRGSTYSNIALAILAIASIFGLSLSPEALEYVIIIGCALTGICQVIKQKIELPTKEITSLPQSDTYDYGKRKTD